MVQLVLALAGTAASRIRREGDRGATAVEYGLIVALIAAVIIVAVAALGGTISDAFSDVESKVDGATGATPAPTTTP